MEDWFGDSKKELKEKLKKEDENRYFKVENCAVCPFIRRLDTQEKAIIYCINPHNYSSTNHNKIIAEVKIKFGAYYCIDLTEFPKWCKLTKYEDLMIEKEYKKGMLSWLDGKKIKKLIK